jgi:hypothetical protein
VLRDQTRKISSYFLTRSCIQNQPKLVRTHSACIWCCDKPRATLDSHDSPRPGLGRCHHHPPSFKIAKVWGLEGHSQHSALKGVEGRVECSGIRLGRDQAIYLLGPASKTNPSWLELILHAFGVGTSHRRPWTHMTRHGPDSEGVTTILPIVFSTFTDGSGIRMALFPGTPKV